MSEYTGLTAFHETDPTGRTAYVRLENQFRETIFVSRCYSDEEIAESKGECLHAQLRMAVDFACDRSWTAPKHPEEPRRG